MSLKHIIKASYICGQTQFVKASYICGQTQFVKAYGPRDCKFLRFHYRFLHVVLRKHAVYSRTCGPVRMDTLESGGMKL